MMRAEESRLFRCQGSFLKETRQRMGCEMEAVPPAPAQTQLYQRMSGHYTRQRAQPLLKRPKITTTCSISI
jgi:hypothetical protein